MKPLTIEEVIQSKMTPIEWVKYFNPEWTNEECDFYLWEQTCYPMDTQSVINQLNNKFLNNERS
jgi:hypothetical protein